MLVPREEMNYLTLLKHNLKKKKKRKIIRNEFSR
jgi:hypothetical protein